MRMAKGCIALDIDGTITDASHRVPGPVAHFLHSLYTQGWELMFITGRAFSFTQISLHVFTFPYYLAVQNGADILHMPSQRLVSRSYMSSVVLQQISQLYHGIPEDFIVYSGYEHGDFCYYRPKNFSHYMLDHLRKIMPLSAEPWKEVDHFDFDSTDQFPLIKCLGERNEMQRLWEKLKSLPHIVSTLIRDPLDADRVYLNLVTHERATKGKALERALQEANIHGYVIAAGDDLNDVSMLEKADCRIVMENAPLEMHSLAHILAPSGQKQGIIPALQEAIRKCPL